MYTGCSLGTVKNKNDCMNISVCHWHAASSLKWSQKSAILIYPFQKFQQVLCNFHYFSCFLIFDSKIYENTLKINDWQKKNRVGFQISRPENIPQKWFSTQNGPLDISSQMRQTPPMEASDFWRNQAKTMEQSF